jgi:putative Holliday junction resolvase
MNVLALDFGLKRIGVAVGSTVSGIAFLRDVLPNDSETLQNLQNLLEHEKVGKILVGMPFKRDGSAGDIEASLQVFLESIRAFEIPLELVDERYTSKMAREKQKDLHLTRSERREPVDSIAAQIFLQEWLDDHAD